MTNVESTFSLDAFLKLYSFRIDARIFVPSTGSFTVDAAVLADDHSSFTLGASLARHGTASFPINAVIKRASFSGQGAFE